MKFVRVASSLFTSDLHKVESLYLIMPAIESLWADACQAAESYLGAAYPVWGHDRRELDIFHFKMREWTQKLYHLVRTIDIEVHDDIYRSYLSLVSALRDYSSMVRSVNGFMASRERIGNALREMSSVVTSVYKSQVISKRYLDEIPYQV